MTLKGLPSWGDAETGYSVDKFYVRSTNKHDHAASHRIYMPPEMVAEIARAVAKYPWYRSTTDFVRDAIYHRLRWVDQDVDIPGLKEWLELEEHNSDRESLRRKMATMTLMVDESTTDVHDVLKLNNPKHTAKLIESLTGMMERMEEPWRSEMSDLIDRLT